MKIIEPISSALLLTGCVYAAGISQNSAFMREFGINPEFSQPSIDKIFYDGGLIAFEIFYGHLKILFISVVAILVVLLAIWGAVKAFAPASIMAVFSKSFNKVVAFSSYVPAGFILLLYIIFLCFSSYQKSQEVGVRLSETFMERCHWVILKDKEDSVKACAFRKDKDSIWYYTVKGGDLSVSSKLLSDLGQVTYLEPKEIKPE